MLDKRVEAEKIVKEMEENSALSKLEEMIKDNQITFDYQEKKYRVRLLELPEKNKLDEMRRKKFGELIQDENILMKESLIQNYKKRGINIDELQDKIKKINSEEFDLQLKLGEGISNNNGETLLKNYKDQIQELRTQKKLLQTQEELLLNYCLENQLESYVYQVITFLSSEILVDEKWKKLFNSFDEFENSKDENLIVLLGTYSVTLQHI